MKVFYMCLDNIIKNINKFTHHIIIIVTAMLPVIFMSNSFAWAINCTGAYTSVGGDFTIPSVNITAPNNGESNQLLYTVNNASIQNAYTDCRTGGFCKHSNYINGYTAYPTNIKGLGVSINESISGSNKPVPVCLEYIDTVTRYNNMPTGIRVTYKLWRTLGVIPPIGSTQITSVTAVATLG